MKAQVTAIGHYLPDDIITNKHLSIKFDIDEARIFERTGIRERRYAAKKENTTIIATLAIQNMLEKYGLVASEIDCLIMSTLAPDYFFPSSSVAVIHRLNASRAWGFDIAASCSGFCYAMSIAHDMAIQGKAKKIVVCAAERLSTMLNNFDYKTGVLFGDGAGVLLIEAVEDDTKNAINGSICRVEADNINDVYFKTPFNTLKWGFERFELKGYKVFQHGVDLAISLIKEYLTLHQLKLEDFKYIVPHQANARMLDCISIGLGAPIEQFLINIENVGNTGSASIPICLAQFYATGKLKHGDRLLLCSFGAGYTIAVVDFNWAI